MRKPIPLWHRVVAWCCGSFIGFALFYFMMESREFLLYLVLVCLLVPLCLLALLSLTEPRKEE